MKHCEICNIELPDEKEQWEFEFIGQPIDDDEQEKKPGAGDELITCESCNESLCLDVTALIGNSKRENESNHE